MNGSEFHRPISLCTHLAASPNDYHVRFTGHGTECQWVCAECAAQYPSLAIDLVEATDSLTEQCHEDGCWDGIQGEPETRSRSFSRKFLHEEFHSPLPAGTRLNDIQPDMNSDGGWMALLTTGELAHTNPRRAEFEIRCRVDEPGFALDDETGLCLSANGDYGAIFQTSNRQACVFDLATGAVSVRIDRGEHHPENSRFPIVFFELDGKTLLVAATAWNRLDVFDPAHGRLLTERTPTSYQAGQERPAHYLDYFHAQLAVSPTGHWIVDNGWVWHPWGLVRSWNLQDWVGQNPWESEDGGSIQSLAGRAYYWDGPICWIDDFTVAVWGWGDDDEWLLPAIRLFDVRDGREVGWFPGPQTRSPRAWPPKKLPPSLFFDEYLFSVCDQSGTGVWDVSTGERLLQDATFAPVHYQPVSREFLSLTADGFRLSRLGE